MNALPVHPFTGLTAIGVLPSGKIVWPVMGGNGDGQPPVTPETPPVTPPVDEKTKGGITFTPEQQAHLDRIVGERVAREKEKYKDYDVFKASAEELEKIKEANKSENEKALDAARKEAAEAARSETLKTVGSKLVEAAFTAGFAGRVDGERAKVLIASLDKKSFLTADGEVDAEKVKSLVDSLAPAGKGAQPFKPGDLGQGGTGSDAAKGGVAAGANAYAQRHANKA
jgi:hypothetical protein